MNKLVIAGSGIKFLSHMTIEVQSIIKKSDFVAYLVNDPAMKKWLKDNSRDSLSLDKIYFNYSDRIDAYQAVCKKIVDIAKKNINSCFITYGHPLILSDISTLIIRDLEKNYSEIDIDVIPGISCLDTLFCDLRVDPGLGGMQAYEATELIKKDYHLNNKSHLILWQIGIIGIKKIINDDNELFENIERKESLYILKQKLLKLYSEEHPIVLYVGSMYPSIPFERLDITLSQLDVVNVPRLSTAYISPCL